MRRSEARSPPERVPGPKTRTSVPILGEVAEHREVALEALKRRVVGVSEVSALGIVAKNGPFVLGAPQSESVDSFEVEAPERVGDLGRWLSRAEAEQELNRAVAVLGFPGEVGERVTFGFAQIDGGYVGEPRLANDGRDHGFLLWRPDSYFGPPLRRRWRVGGSCQGSAQPTPKGLVLDRRSPSPTMERQAAQQLHRNRDVTRRALCCFFLLGVE